MNQAKREMVAFEELIYRFEHTFSVLGRSKTTFGSYFRLVVAVAIYYGKIPTELDQEQIHDYLFYLPKSQKHLHRAILHILVISSGFYISPTRITKAVR
jgi:hypothetical protein